MSHRFLLFFTILLVSCYPAHQHTYPTLDGTYILRRVTVNSSNISNDSVYDYPMSYIYPNPIGVLDTMKVGKSRISFSGNKLFTEYYLENGQGVWGEEYNFRITQDWITGRWVNLFVDYNTETTNIRRHYLIIEDGIEYLIIECPTQHINDDGGVELNHSLMFYREGT